MRHRRLQVVHNCFGGGDGVKEIAGESKRLISMGAGFEQRAWVPTKRRGKIAAELNTPGPGTILLPSLVGGCCYLHRHNTHTQKTSQPNIGRSY